MNEETVAPFKIDLCNASSPHSIFSTSLYTSLHVYPPWSCSIPLCFCHYQALLIDLMTPALLSLPALLSTVTKTPSGGSGRQRANLHLITHSILRWGIMKSKKREGREEGHYFCKERQWLFPLFLSHLFSAFTRLSVGEIMRRCSAGPTTACLAPN